MKQICLGTIITLIYQSRTRSADTIKSVCGGIFAAYGLDINIYNKGLPSHLKSGHDPVPVELISVAKFRFSGLKDFIINNIGSYVFSRAQIKRIYDRTKNQAAIGSQ